MKMRVGELDDAAQLQPVQEHEGAGSPDVVGNVVVVQTPVEQWPTGVLRQGQVEFWSSSAVHNWCTITLLTSRRLVAHRRKSATSALW